MKRAAAFTGKPDATRMLIAVHTVPYPLSFGCPALQHAHLVDQLIDLASRCPFRSIRSWCLRAVTKMAGEGHHVALVHVEQMPIRLPVDLALKVKRPSQFFQKGPDGGPLLIVMLPRPIRRST
jgi:hypothetical protein